MSDPIVTLTTDFGYESPYVAAMKGVILGLNPAARLVDLSHAIRPQDVLEAAFFLAEAIPFFPGDALHVVVVDPGVGTSRSLLYVEAGSHRILAPDNGVLTLLRERHPVRRAIRLLDPTYWRDEVSPTFHGRDILAPVAGHLTLGLDPTRLGPVSELKEEIHWPTPVVGPDLLQGEVIYVDHFGNLLTNIRANLLPDSGPAQILVDHRVNVNWVKTYGDAEPGELVALISSGGWLEIAEVRGNAARTLRLGRGTTVQVFSQQAIV